MENTPQLEDGYTKIANEILEKLATINLSPYQTRLLLYIFRKTYGWGKTEDWVSVSQFVEGTNIGKTHVSRAKKELLIRRIVTSNGNKIAFQKDWRLWRELPKKVTVTSRGNEVTSLGNKVTSTGTYKRNYTKETITKEIIATGVANLNEFIDMFRGVNPNYERLFANKSQRDAISRLILKFGEVKMKNLLTKLPEIVQKPYAPQISTPIELEHKMGKLIQFLNQEKLKVSNGVTYL